MEAALRCSGTIGRGDMTMHTTELTTALTPSANAEAVVDLAAIAHNVRYCANMPAQRR